MSLVAPLEDRVALVTGVSRPASIGAAVALRLHGLGASVVATGWPAHDDETPWGGAELRVPFTVGRHDLAAPDGPERLVEEVFGAHGRLDIVVAAHARSSTQALDALTAEELEISWAVNVTSILLLAKHFAARHVPAPPEGPPGGRLLWFTSGQHLGPMESELSYAVTKGALHQMTKSLDKALAQKRIVANCINPGPIDTGWAEGQLHVDVAALFPDNRWGTPADTANLVEFLVSDEGGWIRGQVIDAEGGFDRTR